MITFVVMAAVVVAVVARAVLGALYARARQIHRHTRADARDTIGARVQQGTY